MRHIEASENCDLHFDYSAVCEIIMDAKNNRQIWKESDAAFLKEIAVEDEKEFQARLKLPSFAQTAWNETATAAQMLKRSIIWSKDDYNKSIMEWRDG